MKLFSAYKFQNFLKNSKDTMQVRLPAWPGILPLISLPALVVWCGWTLPPWCLMWLLAVTIFTGCKWLTWWDARGPLGSPVRSAAYFFLWPGMDAAAFLDTDRNPKQTPLGDWLFALVKIAFGILLLWEVAHRIYHLAPLAGAWTGMVGLGFFLHFGLFHLLSLAWQRIGVAARPLMHWPIAAESLGSFWGERWNRGFNDIAVRHVFRPLCPRVGAKAAMLAAFLFSGVIHDVVITLPAGGGYGQPTLYFLIQAAGLLVERSVPGKRLGLRHGVRGWAFTLAVVAGPIGLLFPPAFVERVMIPFFHFLHVL
jgi:hypothetical protein